MSQAPGGGVPFCVSSSIKTKPEPVFSCAWNALARPICKTKSLGANFKASFSSSSASSQRSFLINRLAKYLRRGKLSGELWIAALN